jgi:hypothetical protein
MDQAVTRQFETDAEVAPRGAIDDLVFARLKQLRIAPAKNCSDQVFVRRAFLDVIGTLPTADEARAFITDPSQEKRSALIDALLQRDEFADYWAMKWSDLLRVKSEFPINLWPLAAQAYHRWIKTTIVANWPYDKFARALLTASGSNFRDPEANFWRAVNSKQPEPLAKAVALTFMGVRAENWPKGRLASMAAFFTKVGYKSTDEWKEEIVFFDPSKALPKGFTAKAAFPDGKPAVLPADKDPREVFADWLISPQNPWFARCIANRVWFWLLGSGIVQEPDDFRPDNPPQNPALLAFLEKEVRVARYDLKHLFKLILNSATYQLSSIPRVPKSASEANFGNYAMRRLDAEVLIDAIDQITGTTEEYSSQTPEPFTFIPPEERSIALADGSITSSFLEMFGRPARDTGMESERNNKPTAAQRLHLLNSTHIRRKIEQGPNMQAIARSGKTGREVLDNLYLAVLSRKPTDKEVADLSAYAEAGHSKREVAVDTAWALFNSTEFLYRH